MDTIQSCQPCATKKGNHNGKKHGISNKKKEFLNTNNLNIRIPEAQKKRHKKTARRHCLMNAVRHAADHSSATQLTQCNNACNHAIHAMRRDIGMK